MTTRTTTCPNCSAKFFITVEQLQQRGGKARCGVCKTIFQADEHLEVTPLPRENDLTTDVPITNPSYARLVALQAQDTQTQASENIDKLNTETEKTIEDHQLIDDNADLGLFDDEDETHKVTDEIDTSAIFGTDISDDFKSTINMPVVKDDPFAHVDTSETVQAVSDEKWLEDLLSEEEPVEEFKKTKEEESEDLIDFLEDIGAHTAQFSTVSAQHIQNQGNSNSDAELPQPIKIPTATQNKSSFSVGRLLSVMLWSLLSILMLALLAGQYLYFNFDTLSRSVAGREKLALVCEHIECNLPNIDADKIAFGEVSTSELNGKSLLTFVIKNQSDSKTLFPAIKISMLKDGKEIGSNIVLPPDYLTANHKKLTRIQPIDGKVLIHLDKSKFDDIKLVALY